jgi:Fe-S cluster assembly protein SufD
MTATAAPSKPQATSGAWFAGLARERLAAAGEPDWLRARREEALIAFEAAGLPTTRQEDWRFTPLQPLGTVPFRMPGPPPPLPVDAIGQLQFDLEDAPLVVVVDGRVVPDLCRIPSRSGIRVTSLAGAISAGDSIAERHLGRHAVPAVTPFGALNTALFADGVLLRVERSVALETPIHVLHLASSAAEETVVSPRMLVVVEPGAQAALVESYAGVDAGEGGHFTNAVCEVVLGENAQLNHFRIQREPETGWHIGLACVDQARDSRYHSVTVAMGCRLSRLDLRTELTASGAEALLYGVYLADHEQLVDHHTAIHHAAPHCNSWEVYKGILADRSRGVFNGKVVVDAIAQRTDAKQTNRNLLLSDHAKIDTKPQLEIFADDVKCTHGATVGRLDEQQRYYLQSRGIAGRAARALLVWAFAAEVLAEVPDARLRQALERIVHARVDTLIE